MSTEDYAAFHAFMAARRDAMVNGIVTDMAMAVEVMRSIPEVDRVRALRGTVDIFLDTLLEHRPDALARLSASRVAVRAEQGVTSEHLLVGVTIFRQHF